ncbi:MAG: hypothetical protein IPL46_26550 [Saprospiraceae bacterium]|nr:hypothetical protein [Saprospiraceae bacterium]
MKAKSVQESPVNIVKLPLTEEAMQLLKSSDESLKDLTKVTNNAGWYVHKPTSA